MHRTNGLYRIPNPAGARLWNSLPADIVPCDTLPHFR